MKVKFSFESFELYKYKTLGPLIECPGRNPKARADFLGSLPLLISLRISILSRKLCSGCHQTMVTFVAIPSDVLHQSVNVTSLRTMGVARGGKDKFRAKLFKQN